MRNVYKYLVYHSKIAAAKFVDGDNFITKIKFSKVLSKDLEKGPRKRPRKNVIQK